MNPILYIRCGQLAFGSIMASNFGGAMSWASNAQAYAADALS